MYQISRLLLMSQYFLAISFYQIDKIERKTDYSKINVWLILATIKYKIVRVSGGLSLGLPPGLCPGTTGEADSAPQTPSNEVPDTFSLDTLREGQTFLVLQCGEGHNFSSSFMQSEFQYLQSSPTTISNRSVRAPLIVLQEPNLCSKYRRIPK